MIVRYKTTFVGVRLTLSAGGLCPPYSLDVPPMDISRALGAAATGRTSATAATSVGGDRHRPSRQPAIPHIINTMPPAARPRHRRLSTAIAASARRCRRCRRGNRRRGIAAVSRRCIAPPCHTSPLPQHTCLPIPHGPSGPCDRISPGAPSQASCGLPKPSQAFSSLEDGDPFLRVADRVGAQDP